MRRTRGIGHEIADHPFDLRAIDEHAWEIRRDVEIQRHAFRLDLQPQSLDSVAHER